jgi:hypothetical protein
MGWLAQGVDRVQTPIPQNKKKKVVLVDKLPKSQI